VVFSQGSTEPKGSVSASQWFCQWPVKIQKNYHQSSLEVHFWFRQQLQCYIHTPVLTRCFSWRFCPLCHSMWSCKQSKSIRSIHLKGSIPIKKVAKQWLMSSISPNDSQNTESDHCCMINRRNVRAIKSGGHTQFENGWSPRCEHSAQQRVSSSGPASTSPGLSSDNGRSASVPDTETNCDKQACQHLLDILMLAVAIGFGGEGAFLFGKLVNHGTRWLSAILSHKNTLTKLLIDRIGQVAREGLYFNVLASISRLRSIWKHAVPHIRLGIVFACTHTRPTTQGAKSITAGWQKIPKDKLHINKKRLR